MVIVEPSFKIVDIDFNPINALKKIEYCARLCYKSEDKITDLSYVPMVTNLIKRKHFAMLEHASFTAHFITDRGVTHEMVRHRLAAYAQESTRYCNYGKTGGIQIVLPHYWNTDSERDVALRTLDYELQQHSEDTYLKMLALGATPQEARRVLTNALKTEIIVTANIRQWRHIFDLRALGVTGAPHPDMKGLMLPFLNDAKRQMPIVFDDLKVS
jgi:thymidylate synthase (FAD)